MGRSTLASARSYDEAHAVAVQKDGKIVVAGCHRCGSSISRRTDFALVRYTVGGLLDASFGSGGIVVTDLGGEDRASGMAVEPDGKVVVVGNSYIEPRRPPCRQVKRAPSGHNFPALAKLVSGFPSVV